MGWFAISSGPATPGWRTKAKAGGIRDHDSYEEAWDGAVLRTRPGASYWATEHGRLAE